MHVHVQTTCLIFFYSGHLASGMESPSSSSSKSSSPFLCWVTSIDSALLSDGESSSLNTVTSSSDEDTNVWCWNNLFERLQPHEKDKVKLFIFHEDRKRALLSIMLQRAAVHQTFDVRNHSHYELKRTREVMILISDNSNICYNNNVNRINHMHIYLVEILVTGTLMSRIMAIMLELSLIIMNWYAIDLFHVTPFII